MLFRNGLATLTETARQVARCMHLRWCKDFVRLAGETFGHVNAVGIQEALHVAKENGIPVTADMIHPAIDSFLFAIESGLSCRGP